MKIALVQLSDIHLVAASAANPILGRVDAVAKAVNSISPDVAYGVLVISGDTAYSGKQAEYIHAQSLIQQVMAGMKEAFDKTLPPVVLVPGNHDCDFGLAGSVRGIVIESMKPEKIDDDIIGQCLGVQKHYETFAARFDPSSADSTTPADRIYRQRVIELGGKRVLFHLLNSAWVSQLQEKPGAMYFPVGLITGRVAAAPAADLVVAVIHHPFNWYYPDNYRELRGCLEAHSDLILTGHEHVSGAHTKRSDVGEQNEYLEGGVLQESSKPNDSSFNVAIFDIAHGKQQTHRFVWQGDHYAMDEEPLWRPFERNKRLAHSEYAFTSDFSRFLDDPGTGYTHPHKDALIISDIFIYPDIQESQRGGQRKQAVVKGRDVVAYTLNHPCVLLIGDEKVGKTSLAKMLVRDTNRIGCVSILFEGDDLVDCDSDDKLRKRSARKLEDQYGPGHATKFWQLDQDKRVAVVDDFHKATGSRRGKEKALGLLRQRFGRVILLAGEEFRLEEVTAPATTESPLWGVRECTILQFGHALRYELVSKWCKLGQDLTEDEAVTEKRIERSEKRLSAIISTDFIPSLPVYILILLQQLEAVSKTKTVSTSTPSGSFGFLYEVLVTASLSRAARPAIDLDTKYNYLTEFAYRLFSQGKRAMPEEPVQHWHDWYCKHYQLRLDFGVLWGELDESGSLDRRNGMYKFKYKYLYYFFVARYLRDHIKTDETQTHLKTLCNQLHHEASANIILFLCHLSKDDSILREMLDAAKRTLASAPRFDISLQTDFLNRLGAALPGLVLDSANLEENRLAYRQTQDETDGRRDLSRETQDPAEIPAVPPPESPQAAWAAAMKTIQILGQVLKNFSGSLPGEFKADLVRESYGVGLRLLGYLFRMVEEGLPNWGIAIRGHLEAQHEDPTTQNVLAAMNKFFVSLLQVITTVVVKYISDSIGTEKVSPTFALVASAEGNPTIKVIDLSVRLDHYSQFPQTQIEELAIEFKRNPFALGVLQYLAWFRFYMYTVDYRIKQSVCLTLGIPVESQVGFLSAARKKGKDKRKGKR